MTSSWPPYPFPPICTPALCPAADDADEKPAVKKPKTKPAPPAAAAAAPAPAPAPTPTAAPAGETPGGGTPGTDVWSKKQGQELVQLVEGEDQRKEVGALSGVGGWVGGFAWSLPAAAAATALGCWVPNCAGLWQELAVRWAAGGLQQRRAVFALRIGGMPVTVDSWPLVACCPALPCPPHPCLQVLGKKKLRWKRIAEHFGKKVKACRKHYHKLTGKEVPEDED